MNIIHNKCLFSLLSQENLVIPDYQRDYAQGRIDDKIQETRTNFIADIIEASMGNRETHMGLVYGSKNIGLEGFVAVDGQQRLTTTFLFHLYISKCCIDRNVDCEKASKLISVLKKFGWNSRIYASEFTEFLFDCEWDFLSKNKLSHNFRKSLDYYSIWENDPTVSNMLVMLDEIHQHMNSKNYDLCLMLGNLMDEKVCKLVFDYKKLEDGTDEFQYQKMNSRGRDLTTYELFKQKLQSDTNLNDSFKDKMDNNWLSFFDNLSSREIDPDIYYQNFINEIALFLGIKDSGDDYKYIDQITASKPIGTRLDVGFVNFSAYFEFINNIEGVEKYLDWFVENYSAISDIIEQMKYRGEELSISAIFDKPTWYIRAVNYAIYFYANKSQFSDFNQSDFMLWWRPVHNLIFNTSIDSTNFNKFIRAIDIFPIIDIDKYIINDDIDFFSTYQIEEEKKKCELIRVNEKLRLLFDKQEKRRRFQGQIGILLPDSSEFVSIEDWNRIVSAFNYLTYGVYDNTVSDFDFIAAMLAFVPNDESWNNIDRLSLKYKYGNLRGRQVPARWIHDMLFSYLNCLNLHPTLKRETFFRYCRMLWSSRYIKLDYSQQKNLFWIYFIYKNFTQCKEAFFNSETKILRHKDGNIWLYHKTNKNDNDVLLSNKRQEAIKRIFPEHTVSEKGHEIVIYDSTRYNLKIVFSSTNIWIGFHKDNPVTIPDILPEGIDSTYWHKAWQWFDWNKCNNFYEEENETFDSYVSLLKCELEEWCDRFLNRLIRTI